MNSSVAINNFAAFADTAKQLTESAIRQSLQTLEYPGNSSLKSAMEYSLFNGGKRIRALLVFAAGKLFSAEHESLAAIAAALEMIHAYSLIHDDLPAMDDDDLRRGQPTCHIQFNEATAILAGDALQTQAFKLLSQQRLQGISAETQLQIVAELANASGALGMCEGQALDLQATGQVTSFEQLKAIHNKKTGALINAALICGALAGSATSSDLQTIRQFGDSIGLAFQIRDDILDIEGNTSELGKPQGSDSALDKSTYPALIGLEQSKQACEALYQNALEALQSLHGDKSELQTIAELIIRRTH